MSERTDVCATCRFWDGPDNWQEKAATATGWVRGECRRRAPTVLILTINEEIPTKMSDWPETHDDEWCGEWQPLTSAPPAL